MLKTY